MKKPQTISQNSTEISITNKVMEANSGVDERIDVNGEESNRN